MFCLKFYLKYFIIVEENKVDLYNKCNKYRCITQRTNWPW